jgi:hypothetical protein
VGDFMNLCIDFGGVLFSPLFPRSSVKYIFGSGLSGLGIQDEFRSC